MIYQVVTRNRLCQSKKYFTSKKDIAHHLAEVIKKTKEYYSDNLTWFLLKPSHIYDGISVLAIDEESLPNWERLVGRERSTILTPFMPTPTNDIGCGSLKKV